MGRKAAAEKPLPPFLWILCHPLCPRPPFCLDTETRENKGFESKRRNAKGNRFRNTATQEFFNDKSTKPRFLEEEFAFLPLHKKKAWLLVNALLTPEKPPSFSRLAK